jgi:hypothetical protein
LGDSNYVPNEGDIIEFNPEIWPVINRKWELNLLVKEMDQWSPFFVETTHFHNIGGNNFWYIIFSSQKMRSKKWVLPVDREGKLVDKNFNQSADRVIFPSIGPVLFKMYNDDTGVPNDPGKV